VQQTVIVVVPFTALVNDIVACGRAAGLEVAEWLDERSAVGVCQLVIVSADRAVQGEFLHYAKGLQLRQQLAHVFFDECHVAFTDASYRERLRELWTLRYLECPFTGLTATLMVGLEHLLCRQLCIENAKIFRQSTTRKTIRYQVRDSGEQPLLPQVVKFVEELGPLASGNRGVVYVRSYQAGNKLSAGLECPFYRARADDKGRLLKQWSHGVGGWIVATGALGTGINIEGIKWVVHAGRPYGLTSFVQQSGHGGRSGEISNSVIITPVDNTQPRNKHITDYSVEAADEDTMTAFIQAQECCRKVLHHYFDRAVEGVVEADCTRTDSALCDVCQATAAAPVATSTGSGAALISQRLQSEHAADAELVRTIEYALCMHLLVRTARQN
jgi:superfamily II DNA helicase RecQ